MTDNDELQRRFDLPQGTLQLAFEPQLAATRDAIRSDAISAGVLDAAEDWIASAELQRRVADQTGKTTRSVRDRLPGLVERRVLAVRGSENRPEYRRTGLI